MENYSNYWKAFTNERETEVYKERTIPAILSLIHPVRLTLFIEILESTKVTLPNKKKYYYSDKVKTTIEIIQKD